MIYRGGTYTETSRITPSVNGTSSHPIIFMSYPGEVATIDTSATFSSDVDIVDESWLVFDGLKLTKGLNNGCIAGGSSNSTAGSNAFSNNIFRHIEASVCFWGLIAIGADNITMEDGVWHDNAFSTGQHGIYLGTRGTEVSLNNVIRRNIFYNNAWNGIHANGAMSGMIMEQNISYNNGIANYDWQNGVINSFFRSNVSIGPGQGAALEISVYDGNEGTVGCGVGFAFTCVCNPANAGAICAHDMTGNLIENFTTYGTPTGQPGSTVNVLGIEVAFQSGCTTAWCLGRNLGSNTFRNVIAVVNTDGSGNYQPIVYPDLGTGWSQSSTFDSLVLWDNDSAHKPNVIGYGHASFGFIGYPCSAPPSGVTLSNCINADPQFLSASPSFTPVGSPWNLNLLSSSPAWGTGSLTGIPAHDNVGNPFNSSTPSMGALEQLGVSGVSLISGTPSASGTFASTIGVTDSNGNPSGPMSIQITGASTSASHIATGTTKTIGKTIHP